MGAGVAELASRWVCAMGVLEETGVIPGAEVVPVCGACMADITVGEDPALLLTATSLNRCRP